MPFKDVDKVKAAKRRYYEENKTKYREKARKKNNLIRRKIIEIKESAPCMDCDINYPHYCMDFDHVRGEKRFNIGSQVSYMTMRTFLEEVEKCDVVCANCHRHRTFMRRSKSKKEVLEEKKRQSENHKKQGMPFCSRR